MSDRFRKRPVEVNAIRVRDAVEAAATDALPGWLHPAVHEDVVALFVSGYALIATLEGTMRGNADDWIIQGVNGEFYPCKPDVFEKTYEPA